MKCPACGSPNIQAKEKDEVKYFICMQCGYNDLDAYDESTPSERNTQREKTKQTPYKKGGGQRSRKN